MLPTKRYLGRGSCPHCNGPTKVRTVRTVSPTFQEHYLDCQDQGDEACGWRGVASVVIERTIAQSARPNPRITLPLAAPRRKPSGLPVPANDDTAAEANAAAPEQLAL